HCEVCGGLIRPDVVWFGEALSREVLETAWQWCENCDICMVIGTSAMVQPAASIPLISREKGAFVIEINKNSTVISSYVDESIIGDVSTVLPLLCKIRT
ncbi:MAG: NAD-dependent deacylase, partial [Candidatus Stahlbacteria bacterium]